MAETEGFTFVDFDRVQRVMQNALGEFAGGPGGEFFCEREDKGGVEAGGGEEFELFVERGDEADVEVGLEDAEGGGGRR